MRPDEVHRQDIFTSLFFPSVRTQYNNLQGGAIFISFGKSKKRRVLRVRKKQGKVSNLYFNCVGYDSARSVAKYDTGAESIPKSYRSSHSLDSFSSLEIG
ncbi:hypothetical protein AQUCO_14200015v1 [Aquilegia coerulea]|uniref:Uncharacterized protein n=1 Tax=Aquilegia coerulea TaxID=218851 RepID=A0A2G5C101_AQUCA|nr:hypothetical protein AQUCO_14200015v1 [Aquilegia coerulea]